MHRFKHGSDLGDLRCLRKPGKLVGGHGQVGTWGLVDIVVVNTDKFVVEVALELVWPSLRVELSFSHHKGTHICSVLRTIDVHIDIGNVVLLGFPFP